MVLSFYIFSFIIIVFTQFSTVEPEVFSGIKKSLLCIIAYQGRKIPRYHPDSHILYLYGLSFCLTCSDRRRLKILVFTCAAPVGKFTCWRIIRKLTADDFLSLYVVQMLLTHSLLFTHLSFYHSLLLCVKIKDIGKCNILKIKSENFLPFLSFFSHGVRTVLTHSDSMPESASGQHDGSFFLTFYFKARTRDGRGTMFIGSVCKIKIQQILSECIPESEDYQPIATL